MEIKFETLANGEMAWLMNEVVYHMNSEDAYYEGSWLVYWPDGESKQDCMEDFAEAEDFDALTKAFIRTCCYYLCDEDLYIKLQEGYEGKIFQNKRIECGGGLYVPNLTESEIHTILEFLKWWGFPMKHSETMDNDLYEVDCVAYQKQSSKRFLDKWKQLNQE